MPLPNPLRVSAQPLTQWFPQPDDYGADPTSVDPIDMPDSLFPGGVQADPLAQANRQLAIQNAVHQGQANQQANAFYAGLPGIDPSTQAGASGLEQLLASNPRAASQPGVAAYINEQRRARMYPNGRNQPFQDKASAFLANMLSLDPTNPQAYAAHQAALKGDPTVLQDPRVAAMAEKFAQQRQSIANRTPRTAGRDIMMQAASANIDPADIPRDEFGDVDEYGLQRMIAQAKVRDNIPIDTRRELISLQRGAVSPSDQDKMDAWSSAHPGQTFNPADANHWKEGFARAQTANVGKLQDLHRALGILGFAKPPQTQVQPASGIKVTRIR